MKLTLALVTAAAALSAQPSIRTHVFESDQYTTVKTLAAGPSGSILAVGGSSLNGFVAKLDPSLRVIYRSPAVGAPSAVAVDAKGDVYVAGSLANPLSSDLPYPVTRVGCQSPNPCLTDAVLEKFDGATGAPQFVMLIGGAGFDSATGVAIAPDGSILLAGTTTADLPTTPGAMIATRPDLPAGFLARISPDGAKLLALTYLNGAPQAMAPTPSGRIVLTGTAPAFTTGTPGAFQTAARIVNLMTSVDGGASWRNLDTPGRAIWVEPDPKQPAVVYAATTTGLFRSADRGASWTSLGGPFSGVTATNVRVDPSDSSRIYAVGVTASVDLASGAKAPIQELWKSSDAGRTWTRLRTFDSFDRWLQIHPSQPETLYLTYPNRETDISTDGGATWTRPPLPGMRGFALDFSNPAVLYAGRSTNVDLYRSGDGGRTWQVVNESFRDITSQLGSFPLFAAGPTVAHGSPAFGATLGGTSYSPAMRRTVDGGATWSDTGIAASSAFVNPYRPSEIFLTGAAGAFVSRDTGATWTHLRANMDNPNVTQAAAAPDGTLYAIALPQAAAFVAEVEPDLSRTTYYTLFGDTGGIQPQALALDAAGGVWIAGSTTSRGMPVGGAHSSLAGYADAFVARFNASGSRLDFARFLGGANRDGATGIALASDGAPYLAGGTASMDLPVMPGALQGRLVEPFSVFLAALDPDGDIQRLTYAGQTGYDVFSAILVSADTVYLGGAIGSSGPAGFGYPQLATVFAVDRNALRTAPRVPPSRRSKR